MTIEVLSFGCRLNAAESDAMRAEAVAAGHRDLVLVNTCAVTSDAAAQARKAIRRSARERPGSRIVVTGCAAQIEPAAFAALPGVAAVIGNAEKTSPQTWRDLDAPGAGPIRVGDIMAARSVGAAVAAREAGRTRALLQVQNGCDHRCTFCVIPFGRGNSRSVPLAEVAEQARRLAGDGVREIVLTGVDITSYGSDLPGAPRLGALVKAILAAAPDLQRLRLS
jgi:threonylcarbamoyladenosine tRNA methylthiotransferase MtaB